MNIPIETVVELLMAQCEVLQDGTSILRVNGKWMNGGSPSSLRATIRTYLSTLVPKPVKLSECEEGLYFAGKYVPGISVMRDGEFAYEADGTCGGLAKDFEVIQPAEGER